MNLRNIVDRIRDALDTHRAARGVSASVLRLGRKEFRALDEFVRTFSLEGTTARTRGPNPTFGDIPIQAVDVESYLSTEPPDLPDYAD